MHSQTDDLFEQGVEHSPKHTTDVSDFENTPALASDKLHLAACCTRGYRLALFIFMIRRASEYRAKERNSCVESP